MKILVPRDRRALLRSHHQHPSRTAALLPRRARRARRARPRGQGDRVHGASSWTTASTRGRSSPRRRSTSRRTTPRTRSTNASRPSSARSSSTPSTRSSREGWTVEGRRRLLGAPARKESDHERPPTGAQGPRVRVRQDRPRGLARGSPTPGSRSSRRAAPPLASPTRESRSRRSRRSPSSRSASTAGSRPCTRASTRGSSPTGASSPTWPARGDGHRALRPRGVQPLPVRRDRRLGRGAGRGDRADRHRRTVDGARRGEEPPERRRRRESRRVRRRARGDASRAASRSPSARPLRSRPSAHTATYDIHVASWMGNVVSADDEGTGFPGWVAVSAKRRSALRYGENPHQAAALYVDEAASGGIANAEQLHGKEMSYNNYVDADAAWRAAHDHDGIAVAMIKHANPCGIAVGSDVAEAHAKAHACDPVSAYGGVIATNRAVTADGRAPDRRDLHRGCRRPGLRRRRARDPAGQEEPAAPRRSPRAGAGSSSGRSRAACSFSRRTGSTPRATTRRPGRWLRRRRSSPEVLADLEFAWRACRSTKSNAILLAKDGASVGIGMGQVNRVDSCRLAVARAGEERAGGSRRPTPTSRSRTGLRSSPRPACAPSSSRADRSGMTRSSPRPRPPGSPSTSPARGTSSTSRTAGESPWGPAPLAAGPRTPKTEIGTGDDNRSGPGPSLDRGGEGDDHHA